MKVNAPGRIRRLACVCALVAATAPMQGTAAVAEKRGSVTLLIVNGGDVRSWRQDPTLTRLLREGSAGLMVGDPGDGTERSAREAARATLLTGQRRSRAGSAETLLGALRSSGVPVTSGGGLESDRGFGVAVVFAEGGRPVAPAAAGALVERTRTGMRPGDLLVVASAVPGVDRVGSRIPLGVAAFVGDQVRPGLLESASTRRIGVVSLSDIAPTILRRVGAAIPPGMTGRPLSFASVPRHEERLAELDRDLSHAARVRDPLMRWLVYAASAILGFGALALTFGGPSRRLGRILLWLAAMPLGFLLVALLPNLQPAATAAAAGGIAAAVALTAGRVLTPARALGVVAGATAGVVLVDLAIGTPIAHRAPISYVVARGDRFYGIGNELMGVVIGGVLASVAAIDERARRSGERLARATPWILAAVVAVLALPQVGAKFGAVLTAVPAFGVAFVRLRGRRLDLTRMGGVLAATLTAAVAVVFIDRLSVADARSHIGAVSGADLGAIIGSKVQAASRLLALSYWVVGLLAVVICAAMLVLRRKDTVRAALRGSPATNASLQGGIVGMFAALLFNDAGVIAAFFIAIFVACMFLRAVCRSPSTDDDPRSRVSTRALTTDRMRAESVLAAARSARIKDSVRTV